MTQRADWSNINPMETDMNTKSFYFFLGLFLIFTVAPCHAQKTLSSITLGNASLMLTDKEISVYKNRALDGSAMAATKLANYYQGIALDNDKALYWLQIAAENGDIQAMHSYWVIASQSDDQDDHRRGLFWLKKAAASKDKLSQEELKSIQKP